ncbi:protein kinase domain-containing protein [Longispora albida]|uniref:protein kinase domain-containing protein n=1 Tax=Longispora albida TaxID=203523 RepID=UPI00035E7FA4|nr:protein kinase family protein [Longispora albida]
MTTFAGALAELYAAKSPADLFAGPRDYHRLARLLHPDAAPPARAVVAADAFARLAALWAEYQGRPVSGQTITTSRHTYRLNGQIATGDIANLFSVTYAGTRAILKLPRRPADNDLMAREATALAQLARDGDPEYRAYIPRLVETFEQEDPATGARRAANVLSEYPGMVTLARVAEAYPDGVDPRDVAWMWRRVLVALGYAHRAGVVHGAVLPEHILIHPAEHGLMLVDWCYSVTTQDSPVPAMVARHRDMYPPEVPARQPATPATDIYLATACMRALMGSRAHPRLARFADGCTLPQPRRRPQDAWRLLTEFDELLENLYGPRTFRPFTVPR